MAFTPQERHIVSTSISEGLDRAELAWKEVGHELIKKSVALDAVVAESYAEPSKIPGHPWVSDGTPKVDEFIALVVDMRNSTEHLKSKINNPIIKDGLQRVFFETSALLPAISLTVSFEDGVVTEYLGDGALILFKVNKADRNNSIKCASRAAKNCINEMRDIINSHLRTRYGLPEVHIGAGLALGKAMVTLVGAPDNLHPKAIGECVWEATKLSGGTNVVHVSEYIESKWPTSKGGTTRFVRAKVRDVNGYRMQNKP